MGKFEVRSRERGNNDSARPPRTKNAPPRSEPGGAGGGSRQRGLFLLLVDSSGGFEHLGLVAELGKALLEIGHIGHVGIEGHGHGVVCHIGLHVLHALFVGDVALHLGFAVDAGHLFHLEDNLLEILGCGTEYREEEDEEKENFFHCVICFLKYEK